MADWISKLDEFLRLSDREILSHAGSISHDDALTKAQIEYDRYAAEQLTLPSTAEQHFDDAVREMKKIEQKRKKPRKKKEEET